MPPPIGGPAERRGPAQHPAEGTSHGADDACSIACGGIHKLRNERRRGVEAGMAVPEKDLPRIQRLCREQVPEHLRDQVRVEVDAAERHVTIFETRPPWDGQGDWARFAIFWR